MSLAAFIRSNEDAIIEAWEAFAKKYLPSAAHMDRAALRDHIVGLLRFIADDLETPETESQRSEKAKGQGPKAGGGNDSTAETHADLRLMGGFTTVELISEFRALRASVIKLWRAEWSKMEDVLIDLLRFNEAIDQIMTESLARFVENLKDSGSLLVESLVHDIRNPLEDVSTSAHALLARDKLDPEDVKRVAKIESSSTHVSGLISDLIDAVGIQIGKDVSIAPAPMDIGVVIRQTATELQALHPGRTILVKTSGDLEGEWDPARVGQVLSNLMCNALQLGLKTSKPSVAAKGAGQEVIVSVHSKGALSPDAVAGVFDPLHRGEKKTHKDRGAARLSLGLFIAKGIMTAHGGKIEVTSSKQDGTMITVHFPRKKIMSKGHGRTRHGLNKSR